MTQMTVKGHTGTITFDGAFVAITRTGVSRLTVGKGEKRIPVYSITAVQMKPAGRMVNGFISFTLGGGNEKQSQFGRQTVDAAGDENSVVFTRKQQEDFEALRDAVEGAIAAGRAPAAPARSEGMDLTDQLQRLGELHAAGVLTLDEFTEKKAELLARM